MRARLAAMLRRAAVWLEPDRPPMTVNVTYVVAGKAHPAAVNTTRQR